MVNQMKTNNFNEEKSNLTTCKACRGMGGRYICVKTKKKNTDVIFEQCPICEGKGKVEDKRTREEKLDDWQNETNLWITCKDCGAKGYSINENGNKIICQTCEGYGVVKDNRTPEEKEAERIEREKQKFEGGLFNLYWEEDFDFYGDHKENKQIKIFEEELNSLKRAVNRIEESNSNKSANILHEIKELSKTIGWISFAAVILIIAQCTGKTDEKIENGVKKIRDDIETLDRSIDKINDRMNELNNKLDDFNYK